MLRGRVQRVTEKLAVMQGRREAIDKSLLELELSRIKLTSSRMLSQDREKLSSIFSEIAGSTAATGAIPDMGLAGRSQGSTRGNHPGRSAHGSEGVLIMEISRRDQPRKDIVALVRWSKKPGENPVFKFIMSSILGLILCLFLMIFLPFLRSFGALVLFTLFFAALLTVRTVMAQQRFMRGLTKRVNDALAEVTSSPGDQLSVRQFRHMTKTGEQLPLLVSGVPGLNLHVARASTLEKHAPEKWVAVFTVVPPENGTASFDRLVAAAVNAGPGTTSAKAS